MNLPLDSESLQLLELVRELASGTRVYLVGGAIRDLMLGRPAKDFDFVQSQGSIPLAKAVSRRLNGAIYTLDDVRHSARVILHPGEQDEKVLDFTSFMGENLEEDLRQRDFTINAMALDLDTLAEVIDPLGGKADLEARQIRLCGPDSLTADPLRVLRGIRLISGYNLKYETEITAAMRVAINKLGLVSGERIRDELFKCLAVSNFGSVAALLSEFGVLDELRLLTFGVDPAGLQNRQGESETLTSLTRLSNMLEGAQQVAHGVPEPDLKHWHTYQVMLDEPLQGGRKRRHLMLLGSILIYIHPAFDADKTNAADLLPDEFSEQIAQALLIGQKEKTYFKAVSGGFLRLADLSGHQPGKLDYYRFFRAFGSYGLESALLAMSEVQSQEPLLQFNPEICREIFHTWFTEQARTVNPPRLVDGDLLQRELAMGPGVKIGTLLEEIREQQVLGKINTTAEAIAFAKENFERNA